MSDVTMTQLTRRTFAKLATATSLSGAASLAMPSLASAQSRARIVIVGGGPGGATVAVLLKQASPDLQVTLIDQRPVHTTCYSSNLYLGGFRSYPSLVHGFEGLRAMGIRVLIETATDIDTTKKQVSFERGRAQPYDWLVLSPGIDLNYGSIEGYSEEAAEIMPHAWRAGPQTQLLKRQLAAMPNGGVVVIAAPALPYRCPPAPYERACMIAHYLKTKKPKSKIILLDAKRSFTKQALFEEAFATLYKDQIELVLSDEIDDNSVVRVDPDTREVVTKSGRKIKASVANIIPPQRAGKIAAAAGCTQGDWCPVHPDSFKSTKATNVYVLGDSAIANEMPKSAFSAHSQGAVVAADILAEVAGKPRPVVRYQNICWSMLGPNNAVKIAAAYTPGVKGGNAGLLPSDPFISKTSETAAVRLATHQEGAAWYDSLTKQLYPRPAEATAQTQPEAERRTRRRRD